MKWLIIALFGGMGGAAPTLCRLASILTSNMNQPLPNGGYAVGVGLYFAIGAVVSLLTSKEGDDMKDWFIKGVAAPGIIAGFLSGTSPGSINADVPASAHGEVSWLISAATAQSLSKIETNEHLEDFHTYRNLNVLVASYPSGVNLPSGRLALFVVSGKERKLIYDNALEAKSINMNIPERNFDLEVDIQTEENTWKKVIHINRYSESLFLNYSVGVSVSIKTEASIWGDMVWSLGGGRFGKIISVEVKPTN